MYRCFVFIPFAVYASVTFNMKYSNIQMLPNGPESKVSSDSPEETGKLVNKYKTSSANIQLFNLNCSYLDNVQADAILN